MSGKPPSGLNGQDRCLTAEQVAEILQMSRNTVYELARQGRLPSTRIGRLVRFPPREEFMAWLRRGTRGLTA